MFVRYAEWAHRVTKSRQETVAAPVGYRKRALSLSRPSARMRYGRRGEKLRKAVGGQRAVFGFARLEKIASTPAVSLFFQAF